MGIFDSFKKFREGSKQKSYEKCGDTLKNQVTTKEQRLEAIDGLSSGPAEQVIPQLLKRFDIVIDHGLQDNREKEMISELILGHKEAAKPFVRNAVKNLKRISWPLKMSEKLFVHEEYVSILLENLVDEFVGFDDSVQERNIEIMLALKEVSHPDIVSKVKNQLKCRDESVRIAAVECLEAQSKHEAEAKSLIMELASHPLTDDNSRFIGLVRSIAQRHQWV